MSYDIGIRYCIRLNPNSMRIPRVYTTQFLQTDSLLELNPQASHYLLHVLRLKLGRPVILFNGMGGEYRGKVETLEKNRSFIYIETYTNIERESPLNIELAIGISRGDRMDWVLQKATELGVKTITPLITERTEVKLHGERAEKKLNHWRQTIISACEQCQRNRLPVLQEPQLLPSFAIQADADLKLVLHHRANRSLTDYEKPSSILLLVGPEGGLSEEEIQMAGQQNFASVMVGPRVLRTETAPLVAMSIAQSLWGDF